MTPPLTCEPPRRGFVPPRNEEEQFLLKRCQELARQAGQKGIPRYSGFLSDREQDLARAAMNREECRCWSFQGGYPQAERRVLAIEPEDSWQEQPVTGILIRVARGSQKLPQHKDYLGALLGLGLERTCVGDIVPALDGGYAVAFVLEDKADFICQNLTQAGSATVSVSFWDPDGSFGLEIPQRTMKTATLSSLRTDAFLAAAMNVSRSTAAEFIRGGRVEINHIPVTHPHEEIYAGDIFTVRGKGRFCLKQIGGKSRKDRIFVEYFQY